jgi:hypothetical protein
MMNADPEYEMLCEIDKWRFVAFVMLELQCQKPVPIEEGYLTRKGFDLKKRPISLTLQMLHTFLDVCNGNEIVTDKTCAVDKIRLDKIREDKEACNETFKKPSLEEIKTYIKDNPECSNVDAFQFFKYFEDGNWHDSKGQPVRNWKQKLRTWSGHKPPPAVKQAKQPDPPCFIDHKPSVQCVDGLCLCRDCFNGWQAMGKQFLWGSMSKAEIEKIVEQGKAKR